MQMMELSCLHMENVFIAGALQGNLLCFSHLLLVLIEFNAKKKHLRFSIVIQVSQKN